MLVDRFSRHISYLRLSVTDRCNLRCQYCMPAEGLNWMPGDQILQDDEIVRLLQDVFLPLGVTKIRLTGGEPLVRKGLPGLVERIARLEGIEDVSLSTNGIFLAPNARRLVEAGLKRVNVSLDSLDPERYREITRGGDLAKVLKGLDAAVEAGLSSIKLNAVIIPGTNEDEIFDFAELTRERPFHVRFIEMMHVGDRSFYDQKRHLAAQDLMDRLAARYPLEPCQRQIVGNGPARIMQIPGFLGTLGFISPMSQTFCDTCNRLRLTADGKIKACLMRPQETDLLTMLRSGASAQEMRELVGYSLGYKPQHHEWGADLPITRTMSQIGG